MKVLKFLLTDADLIPINLSQGSCGSASVLRDSLKWRKQRLAEWWVRAEESWSWVGPRRAQWGALGPCVPHPRSPSQASARSAGLTFPMSLPLLFMQMYFSLSAPLMRTRLPNVSVSTMSLAVMGEGERDFCP